MTLFFNYAPHFHDFPSVFIALYSLNYILQEIKIQSFNQGSSKSFSQMKYMI